MERSALTYQELERRFVAWAQAEPGVRAAVVVGSRAGDGSGADEWSDLDIILFAAAPGVLAADPGWLAQMGQVWVAASSTTGRGDPEWMAVFEGGLKLDVVLAGIGADVAATAGVGQLMAASAYGFVFGRGARVLLDKHGPAAGDVTPGGPAPKARPDAEAFEAAVSRTLVAATRAARLLRRGDLWRAKQAVDCALKDHLLSMLEWHAQAMHGPGGDTAYWNTAYDGRSLARWAGPGAVEALPATFGAYEVSDLKRALSATLELYRRLAVEVAGQWGYRYPQQAHERIAGWVGAVLDAV